MKEAIYIGDGVYVQVLESGIVVLTTGHHIPDYADNTIYLERFQLDALLEYLDK